MAAQQPALSLEQPVETIAEKCARLAREIGLHETGELECLNLTEIRMVLEEVASGVPITR